MSYDLDVPADARLWPYGPDFARGFEITRSFLTDIASTRSNNEQRRALRDVPRISARYTATVKDGDYRDAKLHLRARQNKPAAVPDFSRYALTSGAAFSSGTALSVASPPAWMAEGQMLALSDCSNSELVEIDGVAGSTISLADPLLNDWPAGSTVRPVLHGLLEGSLRSSIVSGAAAEFDIGIAAYPGGEPPEDEGSPSTIFNGYEVFPDICGVAGIPSIDFIWPVEQVDFSIGRTAQFRPIDLPQHLAEIEFDALSASQAQAIIDIFLRAKGRRGAFYRGTGENDLALAADASGSTIDVIGPTLALEFGSFDFGSNDVAIEIIETDGNRLHRLITGVAQEFGNSRITLNSAVTLAVSATARISWLPLCRFASDDLTLKWYGGGKGAIRAGFQTVKR